MSPSSLRIFFPISIFTKYKIVQTICGQMKTFSIFLIVASVSDWDICGVLPGLHDGVRVVGDGALPHTDLRHLHCAGPALLSRSHGVGSVPKKGLHLRFASGPNYVNSMHWMGVKNPLIIRENVKHLKDKRARLPYS